MIFSGGSIMAGITKFINVFILGLILKLLNIIFNVSSVPKILDILEKLEDSDFLNYIVFTF
jgi:hypothetical protein